MNLEELRTQIDAVDKDLIHSLKKRFDIVKKMGELKKQSGNSIHQPKREEEILNKLRLLSKENNIDFEFLKNLFEQIFEESKHLQK